MNEDVVAWEGLGPEYHARLAKNYITWVRNYCPAVADFVWDKEKIGKVKERIYWSLGALMPMGVFFDNVVLCTEVGIRMKLLQSKHFPQVSIPGALAEYVKSCCE